MSCRVVWQSLVAAVALVGVLASPTWAQAPAKPAEKDLVAVLDLDSLNVDKAQMAALTEELRSQLLQSNRFRIVDRQQIEVLLKEQAFQQSGCTSQECAVQVGKILGVRKMVTGRVTKVDANLWQVSGQMVDVESAETLKAVTVNHQGDFTGLLTQGMATLAQRLAATDGAGTAAAAAGANAGTKGALRLAVFPGSFSVPNPKPDNWYLYAIQKGIESARAKMPIDVAYSFYPAFVDGKPIQDTSGLERGSWSLLQSLKESFAAERAQQLGVDAALLVKVILSGNITVLAYVVDAKSHKVYEQQTELPDKQGTRAVVEAVTNALLRYQTYGR
jgi:hypothetical protein